MEQEIFEYTYCPPRRSEVRQIRDQYLPRESRETGTGVLARLRGFLRALLPAAKS